MKDEDVGYDEIELDDTACQSCGCDHTWRRECYACHGEGFRDLHDEDPLWCDEGDTEDCGECRGAGWLRWCRKCGYDFALGRRIGDEVATQSAELRGRPLADGPA